MVDAHTVPLFELVCSYVEILPILCSKSGWFSAILLVENASEKMVLELNDEVLDAGECEDGYLMVFLTFSAGSPGCCATKVWKST